MKIKREHRNLLIAMAIGDGHIDKSGKMTVFHSEKQLEYVVWKFNLVRYMCTHKELIKRNSNGTIQYGFRLKNTSFTKLLRRVLYPQGIKRISTKILNRLNTQHLAIWWMDDGSCSIKKNSSGSVKATVSTLSTCTTKEQNQIIIDWLQFKYNIRFGQRKMKNHHSLICGTKEGRKLAELLSPYTLKNLQYKLSK